MSEQKETQTRKEFEQALADFDLKFSEHLLWGKELLDPVCGNCKVAEWVPGNGNVWRDCPKCKSEEVKSEC